MRAHVKFMVTFTNICALMLCLAKGFVIYAWVCSNKPYTARQTC